MAKEAMSELQVEIEVNFVIDFKAQNFHSEASLTTGSAKKGQVCIMFVVDVACNVGKCTILEPKILGNHNINTGTTLLLKTIVN